MSQDVSVLVVDDEPLIAQAHGQYVERIDGFRLAGTAHSGREALRLVRDSVPDLILLDLNLPDTHGLELCRSMRAAGLDVDVIAVTSERDLAAVRAAVALGVVHYLLKPFTFRALQERLERYRDYRTQMIAQGSAAGQSEIDQALAALRTNSDATLPTGLSDQTLETIVHNLASGPPRSAAEIARSCDISRVTARRYLEHLTSVGSARRTQRYGRAGRPEVEYAWRSPRRSSPDR